MKIRDYSKFYSDEIIDESKREMFEGYPVYTPNESIYNKIQEEDGIDPGFTYGFDKDNYLIYMRR